MSLDSGNPKALLDLGLSTVEVVRLLKVGRTTLWRYTTGAKETPERVALAVRAVVLLAQKAGTPAALARIRARGVVFHLKP